MFFQKKKDMIDIRDLPRKNAAFDKSFVPKDGLGFVDLTKKRILPSELRKQKLGIQPASSQPVASSSSSSSGFSFFDSPTQVASPSLSSSSSGPSSETDEMLRKISMQVSDLDSKIYKMEQRIELLERKAGITDSSSSNSGFSW
jgi:hypothetical protein